MFGKLFASATVAHAHCDLYCGVYDPAQAKIEALSVVKTAQKYQDSDDDVFRARCISIKEERAEETKHHLMVLWADFFAPAHFEEFPQLHELFWKAIHQAGEAKKSMDPAVGEQLVSYIDDIAEIFWKKKREPGITPAWHGLESRIRKTPPNPFAARTAHVFFSLTARSTTIWNCALNIWQDFPFAGRRIRKRSASSGLATGPKFFRD